jgi:thiopeptide-type bacteriocin biosynthesis protein
MNAHAATRQWLSFHLFLGSHFDEFLVDHLAPALQERTAPGSPGRFFFIRYGEGGTHLRLRFRPRYEGFETGLGIWLQRIVGKFTADMPSVRLEAHTYDRKTLYFGETTASVYSELLNEQTSWLAIHVMRAAERSQAKSFCLLVVILSALFRSISLHSGNAITRHWKAFTMEELRRLAVFPEPLSLAMKSMLPTTISKLLNPIAEGISAHKEIRRIAALIRRTLRIPQGLFVATHALHLLCNKVGLSLQHEFWMAEALDTTCVEERCHGEIDV